MKKLLSLVLAMTATASIAQAPNPTRPIAGVHYTFQRMIAERAVDDEFDEGKIRLVSYVYQPIANSTRDIVVLLHGSTGGMAIDPAEPELGSSPPVSYFTKRGYTVVIPMRRGRSESSGRYIEECPYQARKCSLADYRELTRPGLADALLSTEAVIDQIVLQRLKPRTGRFLLWGGSRGAVLALAYAATHPQQVRGVVAASAGWLSIVDKWPAEENEARLRLQRSIFSEAARYRGPTLWIYADADPFYAERIGHDFYQTYMKAGGTGRYVHLRNHGLANGHVPPLELWQAEADRFLNALP